MSGRHQPEHGADSAEGLAAVGVRRIFRLYADAHLSNLKGQRAGMELAALAEDWFDSNVDGGWPLPRVVRMCSACSLPAVRDGLCAGHDRLATQDYSEIAANE